MDAAAGAPLTLSRSGDAFAAMEAPEIAALISAASDVAVVLDTGGIVRDLAVSDSDLPRDVFEGWLGNPFADNVTVESRPKVERLLAVGRETGPLVIHTHVNHPRGGGEDLPIRYASAPLGEGHVIALGRDLSPIAAAQRRLLAAQRAAEREYQKLKSTETRFREYFHLTREPALFVDADDRVSAANQAAQATWPRIARLSGRRVGDLLRPPDRETVSKAIAEARHSQTAQTAVLQSGNVSVAPLRRERGALLLRFSDHRDRPITAQDRLVRAVETMPDGFVVTDVHFNVLIANEAFAAMTEAGNAASIAGQSLDRWLGRPGVDLSVIRTALAETGTLRAFATVVKGELGQVQDVDVSAAKVSDPEGEYIGLAIRQAAPGDAMLPTRSAQQLADLVGRVPIKEIVRETTDTIEQMCIEAALELSGDNRASAAELLGLSRQSLYVKMRRFGIVDPDPEEPGASS